MKKKTQAAVKSLFGRSKKSPKGDEPTSSHSSIQGGSPMAEATEDSPATTAAASLVSPRCSTPSEVANNGTRNGIMEPGNSASLTLFTQQRTSRCLSELNDAINEFRKHYVQFSKANSEYMLIDDELENVLPDIATVTDVREVAKIFEQNVTKTIRIKGRKKLLTESHWPTQVSLFLSKLYPIAKLSCSLMDAVAEVSQSLVTFNI